MAITSYGAWKSPITAENLVAGAAALEDVQTDGDDVVWSESRPDEGGRSQIVRRAPDGSLTDLLGVDFSARTRVHEYGGAAWIAADGIIYFSNWSDQRVYRLAADGNPQPITPSTEQPHQLRFADFNLTPDGRWLLAVCEDHRDSQTTPSNRLVAIHTQPDGDLAEPVVLHEGSDFVAAPRVSHDGRQLAWLTWNHPDMPWDATELWIASLLNDTDGLVLAAARQQVKEPEVSLMQPMWGRDGELFVITDAQQWWNVARVHGHNHVELLHPVAAEVGGPAWILGLSDYGINDDGTVVASVAQHGRALLLVHPPDGPGREVPLSALGLRQVRVTAGHVTAIASSDGHEPEVIRFPIADPTAVEVLRPARVLGLAPGLISKAEHRTFTQLGRSCCPRLVLAPSER